jgi:hypothetical protein
LSLFLLTFSCPIKSPLPSTGEYLTSTGFHGLRSGTSTAVSDAISDAVSDVVSDVFFRSVPGVGGSFLVPFLMSFLVYPLIYFSGLRREPELPFLMPLPAPIHFDRPKIQILVYQLSIA